MLTGVLMAAGLGARLGAGTTKALVEIEGRPLCYYAIDFLRSIGVDKIIVIGGCDFEKLQERVIAYDKDIEIIENKEYKKGNLYTLLKALPKIEDSFLLCNTDHIYKKQIAGLVKNQLKGIRAFCDIDRELGNDDMKVWHAGGRLNYISKQLEEFNGGYVGLTYCGGEHLDEYKKCSMEILKKGNENAVAEDIVRMMAEKNMVEIGDISGHGWLEVDFPEELENAKKEIKENKELYYG